MSILADWEIAKLAKLQAMISPFVEKQVRDGCISYGLSSYGYDIRVADEFKLIDPSSGIVDPKNFGYELKTNNDGKVHQNPAKFEDIKTNELWIPANSFALARSVEKFIMPRDVLGLCVGKSTYARCGIVVNTTPLEPGWRGFITLELSNTTPLPAKIYANEGIAQVIFFKSESQCETSYADRSGKYQNQVGIVTAKL
jgi:dCTP deaminase